MKKPIKILGGGIAGLTAAINLRHYDIPVEVHEIKNYCGKHYRDFQFLENWTPQEDILELLKQFHIKPLFYFRPYTTLTVLGPTGKTYIGQSEKPFMYLVRRGQHADESSIDRSLEKQTLEAGVNIIYGSSLSAKEADIIATGVYRPTAVGWGILFPYTGPDQAFVLLDNDFSRRAYAYCIVDNNVAEITCGNDSHIPDMKPRFERTVSYFKEKLKIGAIKNPSFFSASVNIGLKPRFVVAGKKYVGEAAGLQDWLAGFGMMYAFESGYLAAKAIAESLDYEALCHKTFDHALAISRRNRTMYNCLTNFWYDRSIAMANSKGWLAKRIRGGNDLGVFLKRIYTYPILKLLTS